MKVKEKLKGFTAEDILDIDDDEYMRCKLRKPLRGKRNERVYQKVSF